MDPVQRMNAILQASPEVLSKIDAILEGKCPGKQQEHTKLLTMKEARTMLGWSYPKLRRAVDDGLLDVVAATGQRLIKEESLYELANGTRQPSQEVLARREQRNAARREEYRRHRDSSTGAARDRQSDLG